MPIDNFFLINWFFHKLGRKLDPNMFLLTLLLFIPLGLTMDFVHEYGHAFWGTIAGGKLSHLQVTYLIVYPRLAFTSDFHLGLARVEGLAHGSFEYGLFLLGGSITTNAVSWVVGLVLLLTNFGEKVRLALKALGLWGILDLPFYVLFPQIGLSHWIVIGGNVPEPLLGARMIGIPDIIFYLLVILSTSSLVLVYIGFFYDRNDKDRAIGRLMRWFRSQVSAGIS